MTARLAAKVCTAASRQRASRSRSPACVEGEGSVTGIAARMVGESSTSPATARNDSWVERSNGAAGSTTSIASAASATALSGSLRRRTSQAPSTRLHINADRTAGPCQPVKST